MKYLGEMYCDSIFGIACSDGGQEMSSSRVLGIDDRKKTSWTSFLIRNDFGIAIEKHETVKLPMFVRRI